MSGGPITLPTLSLVIPAYNEEARLPALLETLSVSAQQAASDGGMELLESVVVDDGSSDRTPEILSEAAPRDEKLRPVLSIEENRGKGGAVAEGVRAAQGDYVLIADADLSTPLEELHKLTAAQHDGSEIVIGSRGIDKELIDRGPLHRRLTGRAFNKTVRLMTGLDVRDTQCGFKLLETNTAKRLFAQQTCPGFAFDVELLLRAKRDGIPIVEVPVIYIHDSRSRVRVTSATPEMLRDVAALSYRIRRRGGEEDE